MPNLKAAKTQGNGRFNPFEQAFKDAALVKKRRELLERLERQRLDALKRTKQQDGGRELDEHAILNDEEDDRTPAERLLDLGHIPTSAEEYLSKITKRLDTKELIEIV